MSVDYDEAWERLEQITGTEAYEIMVEEVTDSGESAQPNLEMLGDRAVFYLQINGNEYSRAVIGEYRESSGLGPVPWSEEELERVLDGRGEVEIHKDVLEPREINYPEQRNQI